MASKTLVGAFFAGTFALGLALSAPAFADDDDVFGPPDDNDTHSIDGGINLTQGVAEETIDGLQLARDVQLACREDAESPLCVAAGGREGVRQSTIDGLNDSVEVLYDYGRTYGQQETNDLGSKLPGDWNDDLGDKTFGNLPEDAPDVPGGSSESESED